METAVFGKGLGFSINGQVPGHNRVATLYGGHDIEGNIAPVGGLHHTGQWQAHAQSMGTGPCGQTPRGHTWPVTVSKHPCA